MHAGGLAVLDLASGDVVAEAAGTASEVVRRAAWRADGSAVDYAQGQDLVTLPVDGGEPTSQPSPFAEASALAWAPTGEQLVALEGGGVLRLRAAPADSDGRLGTPKTIDTSGISLDGLLGFSGTARSPSGPTSLSRATSSGSSTCSSTEAHLSM